jgi:uncharacterized protein YutE (UPF0331/DUF86 family)
LRTGGERTFHDDEDRQWVVERGLQLGCEAILDAGNHVLSAAFGRPSETYEAILAGLAAERVISAELRAELEGLAGFRNVLVHGYLDLDPVLVCDALMRAPERFERFATELHAWLARRGSE